MAAFVFQAMSMVVILGAMGWMFLASHYFSWLRSHHPDIYRALGGPTLTANFRPGNSLKCLKYVMSNRFLATGDAELIRRSRLLRQAFIAVMAVFALGTVADLFIAVIAG